MKTTSTSRSRLTCRVVRAWSVLGGAPRKGAPARHVAGCPECRAHFAAESELEARLRRAAPHHLQPLPDGFEHRMERALAAAAREDRAPARPATPWLALGSAFAGVAAVIVLAVFLMRPADRPASSDAVADAAADPKAVLEESMQVAQALNDRFWNDVAPTATSFVRENPLQQEMSAVYSDARSALQFLARNFLPDNAGNEKLPAAETDTQSG